MITKARLIAYGVAAALLIAALLVINHWRENSAKLDQVTTEYDNYRKAVNSRDDETKKLLAQDQTDRKTWNDRLDALQGSVDALAKQPVKEVTYHEVKLENGTICPVASISADWFRLYNATSRATAAAPAQ